MATEEILMMAPRPREYMPGRSAAFKRTAAGDGRAVVIVAGEAGLGKTTLVAEVAREAFDAGACVLLGHAEEDLSTRRLYRRRAR